MGLLGRLKETIERMAGVTLRRRRGFPFVTAERRFLNVRFDLHNRCNLRCSICYYAIEAFRRQPLERMSDEVIEAMAREIWPRTRELWFSCGYEPLLAPNLAEVLIRAKASGIPAVRLVTNGLLLNEEKARMLIDAGLDGLMVSIDGARRDTYEAIRQGSDFERVIGNVRRLQEIKRERGVKHPELCVNSVMTAGNITDWADVVHLAADLGAGWISLSPQTVYEGMEPEQRLREIPEQVNAALDRAREAAAQRGIFLFAPAGFDLNAPGGIGRRTDLPSHCEAPWISLTILPDGEVISCYPMSGQGRFGNLKRQSFDDIYYGKAMRELRENFRAGRPDPVCRVCALWHNSELNQAATHQPRVVSLPK